MDTSIISDAQQLATPVIVVNAAIAKKNLRKLADYAKQHGLGIRPHTKTHKSKMISRLQLETGSIGLTVAKVGEAEQMAEVCDDILMAYPAVDSFRTNRLAELAKKKTVRVGIDSTTAIEALTSAAKSVGSTIGLLVDIDVGMGRTGVATAEESLQLAQLISKTSGVRLDGIMCYPGHIGMPADQQQAPLAAVSAKLEEAINLWSKNGLSAKIVSGGSTPTAYQSHLVKPYTEIRPGTHVFNDMNIVRGGFGKIEDVAARIHCTVISDAVKNQIVLDGGSKTFTSDLCGPARDSGHGCVVEYPEAKITRLSEEHAQVDVSKCAKRPKVGERVTVIPNHICPCINLQDAIWWQEEDNSLRRITVDARGKLS
jgi:D-serine deaminase-like pyridoxal phosphate-dependent protein